MLETVTNFLKVEPRKYTGWMAWGATCQWGATSALARKPRHCYLRTVTDPQAAGSGEAPSALSATPEVCGTPALRVVGTVTGIRKY